jgi:hypothetical protein
MSDETGTTELCNNFYRVYPNIQEEFFSNSSSEKWGVVLSQNTKVHTFCVGIFLQNEDCEGGHLTFGHIQHLQVVHNFMVPCVP